MRKKNSKTPDIDPEIEISTLPVDLNIYDQVMNIFKKTLGVLYDTDYYVAKKPKAGQ
jgi:hypothetical protein